MSTNICPKCGTSFDANTPEGLCPLCLLATGLEESNVNTIELAPSGEPSSNDARPEPERVRYFGDYELLDEIARGGMGIVYRARQTSLDRVVALKVILSGELASDEAIARFRREAEASANLDHPHIVPIYEVGEHEGRQYFSMKLIEGTSLAGTIPEEGATTPERQRQAVHLMRDVARAVHHAHQRGILHRDLKPGNILLDAQGQPHVTDFGLAKRVGDSPEALTRTGSVVGTPAYMAPEQARADKELTPAVDVYGLGAILYELLTGRPPFQAESPLDTILQVLEEDPRPPRHFLPGLPSDLDTICSKCLAKDPAQRYASADGLADDLERWLRGEPISARPATRGERLLKWIRRRPAAAALLALAAFSALLLAGLVVGLWYNQRLQEALRQTESARTEADRQRRLAEAARLEADRRRTQAEVSNRRSREYLYASDVALAQRYWERGNLERMRELLGRQRRRVGDQEDRRGFEWYYLWRLCHTERRRLDCPARHYAWIGVVLSPDGKTLAAWHYTAVKGRPIELRTFDASTGKELGVCPVPTSRVERVAFGPVGRHLLVVGYDDNEGIRHRRILLWKAGTAQRLADLSGLSIRAGFAESYPPRAEAFSPDGKLLAVVGEEGVLLWDIVESRQRRRLPLRSPSPWLAFSPDGATLACAASGGPVYRWKTASGRALPPWDRHANSVVALGFTPEGRWLVTLGLDDVVGVHSLRDEAEPKPIPVVVASTSKRGRLLVAPDGKTVAVFNGEGLQLWDLATGSELLRHSKKEGEVRCCVYSPDGKTLALGEGSTIRLWQTATGKPVLLGDWRRKHSSYSARDGELRGHTGPVTHLAFSPDSRLLASSSGDRTACLWDAVALRHLLPFKGYDSATETVEFTADGSTLVVRSGRRLSLLDATAYPERANPGPHTWAVQGLAFLPDSQRLIACDYETAHVYDVGQRRSLRSIPTSHWVFKIALSRDGSRLLTVGNPAKKGQRAFSNLRLWDPAEQEALADLEGLEDRGEGVAGVFSPDGRLLAASIRPDPLGKDPEGSPSVGVWDVVTGGLLAKFEGRSQVAWLPDGERLVVGGKSGITLESVRAGGPRVEFANSSGPVRAFAVAPEGTRLAVVDAQGQLGLWSTSAGKRLRGFALRSTGSASLVFGPTGDLLLVQDHAKQVVHLWDLRKDANRASVPSLGEIAVSPDGKTLATKAKEGIVLWQLATGQEMLTLTVSESSAGVTDLVFSPDGRTLAAATGWRDENDGVQLWRAASRSRADGE